MILQLNPGIPLKTPKGDALAHFVIDYGIEHDLEWVCFIDETGECWTIKNRDIRAQKNITWGRLCAKESNKGCIKTLGQVLDEE
jgi:transcription elongation factor